MAPQRQPRPPDAIGLLTLLILRFFYFLFEIVKLFVVMISSSVKKVILNIVFMVILVTHFKTLNDMMLLMKKFFPTNWILYSRLPNINRLEI